MRASLRGLALAAASAGVLAATSAAPASAATPYPQFKTCPASNPAVAYCLTFTGSSGAFRFGKQDVPVSKPITLNGGFGFDDAGKTVFYPATGGPTLSPTPLAVPGGLLGLMDTRAFGGPLLRAFQAAAKKANAVTATPELVGPVKFDFDAFFTNGETIVLPLRIKLDNPFLGSSCFIGSANKPVTLRLRTETFGEIGGEGAIISATGARFVDTAFAAPAASNCGTTFLDKPLVTGAVNLKVGLPAAAGRNSAALAGDAQIVDTPSLQG